jgi:hypothetical protein
MMYHPIVKESMPGFVQQYVIPELSSAEPYMRAIVRGSAGRCNCHFFDWPSVAVLGIRSSGNPGEGGVGMDPGGGGCCRPRMCDGFFILLPSQLLLSLLRSVQVALAAPELPVRVQATLALTEMITSHDAGKYCLLVAPHYTLMLKATSVRKVISPQVGNVVQGDNRARRYQSR